MVQVQQFQETASRLHAQYAGDRADAIRTTEKEVVDAWKGLLDACDGRRAQLVDTAEKFRFFSMVRDLTSWMESTMQQIETQEKPRYFRLITDVCKLLGKAFFITYCDFLHVI